MCISFVQSQTKYTYELNHFTCVPVFATLWPIAHQTPLSMGFSRQAHWSGLPCPPPGDLSNPGIESASLKSPALAGGFHTSASWGGWEHLQLMAYHSRSRRKWRPLTGVQLFVTPWTIQSMEFSRPEYWSGSLSLLQGIFPTQGLNPGLLHYRKIL